MWLSSSFKRIASSFMAFTLVLSLIGTLAPGISAAEPAVTGINANTTQVTLEVGEEYQASVAAVTSEGYVDVTEQAQWDSSRPAVATVANGVITGVAPGTTIIGITYDRFTVTISVTVQAPAPTLVSIEPFQISSPISLSMNSTPLPIWIMATYSDSSSSFITTGGTWVSGDANVVTVQDGMLTPIGLGSTTVTFSYETKEVELQVTVLPALTGIWIDDPNPTVLVGAEHSIRMQGVYADESVKDIDPETAGYSADDSSIAEVSSSGVIKGVSAGDTIIRIFYNDSSPIEINVKVLPVPTSLTASLSSIDVKPGGTAASPVVHAHYGDSTEQVVTDQVVWATADPAVATVSNTGVVTGVGPGLETELIVTFRGVTLRIPIRVAPLEFVRLKIEPEGFSLYAGETRQLVVRGVRADNSLSDPLSGVKYWSSNTLVLTIDENGLAKAGYRNGSIPFRVEYLTLSALGLANVYSTSAGGITVDDLLKPTTPPAKTPTEPATPTTPTKPDKPTGQFFPVTPKPAQPVFNARLVDLPTMVGLLEKANVNSSAKFKDPLPSWGADAIDRAARLEIISGYPDNSFQADRVITRAEFATMVYKAFALSSQEASGFADTRNHWAAKAIEALGGSGIVFGLADGNFHPDQSISRAKIVAILSRLTEFVPSSSLQFADIQGNWAVDAINAFGYAGVISGKNGTQFDPAGEATRAEAVKIIIGLLDVLTGQAAGLTSGQADS